MVVQGRLSVLARGRHAAPEPPCASPGERPRNPPQAAGLRDPRTPGPLAAGAGQGVGLGTPGGGDWTRKDVLRRRPPAPVTTTS